jgi:tetratricopeptide (TPR) repeat protein
MIKIIINTVAFLLLLSSGFWFPGCSSAKTTTKPAESASLVKEVAPDARRRNAGLFAEGVKERLKGNDNQAIQLFEQALDADPGDHASMYELAELYARTEQFERSYSIMEQAVQLQPENTWYQIRMAQLYRKFGKADEFIAVYKNLVKKYPTNPEYIGELSTGLLFQEKYDDAITIYNQLESVIGVNEMLSLQKQAVYMVMDQPDNATREIEKLSAAYPYESRYLAMLAELYLVAGNKEKALEAYTRLDAIDPENQQVHVSLFEFYYNEGLTNEAYRELELVMQADEIEAGLKLQALLYWLNTPLEKVPDTDMTISLISAFISSHSDDPRGWALMGEIHYNQDELEKAREYFLQSLEVDSSNFRVWENLLMTDLRLFEPSYMAEHGTRAQSLFPEQPLPYFVSGIGLYQLNRFEEALKSFENGRKFVAGNDVLMAEFYSMIGDTQNKLGNYRASDLSYEKALVINPDNSVVLNNYAYYLSLRGEKLDQAATMALKAVTADTANSSNLDTYAWVLYKQGKYEEALVQIQLAVQHMEKDSGTILEHYGDILFRLGRNEEALNYWKRAREAGETTDLIDKKIETGQLHE